MFMQMTSVRFAVRLAPFLALPLLGTLAAGCGDSQQHDPTIKVEQGKDLADSVSKKGAPRGTTKQDPAPKQRVGRGPD